MKYRLFVFLWCCIACAVIPVHANVLEASLGKPIQKVLVVVAMDTEAQPIIDQLHLHPLPHSFSDLPMHGYTGQQGKIKLLLMVNGQDPVHKVQNIGTEAATLSTYLGIEYFHPDLIISIGTAGAVVDSGAALMDIYLSQKIYFFDRRIPMKGYHDYGRGGYPSMPLAIIDKKLGFKSGIVCSGDSFDEEQVDYNLFLKEHCSAIDMEAAGVAWVSMLTKTPMIAIKGITNFVRGKHVHAQFEKNLPVVTSRLANKLKELIGMLSVKLEDPVHD